MERQRQIQEMQQTNAKLDREIEQMRDHIKRLTDNPAQQELEIRERLKLVKPGEKVYVTGDPSKQDPAKQDPARQDPAKQDPSKQGPSKQ
jgi:cell division protein FtsB